MTVKSGPPAARTITGAAEGPGRGPGFRAETRRAIVLAVEDLLAEVHPAALSVPAVAERAGVSVRTVYRYFPSKEDLLDAAAERWREDIGRAMGVEHVGAGDLTEFLPALWHSFAGDIEAVRRAATTDGGRDARRRRLRESRSAVRASLADRFPDIPEADRHAGADLLIAVTSSAMFLELVDRMGLDPADAATLARFGADAVVSRLHHRGGIR